MILEFLCGTLPWKGKTKETIGQLKVELTNSKLFADTCPNLVKIHDHLKTLGYSDKPDYDYICQVFDLILKESESENLSELDKMDIVSVEKTEDCLSLKSPDEDEIAPVPFTSPQMEKNNQNQYFMDAKETATLFESVEYAKLSLKGGIVELDAPTHAIMIPR